jgi:hypothetical protein
MNPEHFTYIGIDVAIAHPMFAYVALDGAQKLMAVGSGHLEEILAFCAGQTHALAAINAPISPNHGLMKHQAPHEKLPPGSKANDFTNLRQGEFELITRGVASVQHTPSRPEKCPAWMRRGFLLYGRLKDLGYCLHPDENSARQYFETHAEAAFQALIGQTLLNSETLEGRLQRQLILHEKDLPVSDPMDFFEEITRHKLIHGILPLQNIFSSNELNALIAAYTAWLVINQPQDLTKLGDPQEGLIYLPPWKKTAEAPNRRPLLRPF